MVLISVLFSDLKRFKVHFTIITCQGAVVVVIVWLLDLQLYMQSVPITTDVVSSNLDQGEVHNIMWSWTVVSSDFLHQ